MQYIYSINSGNETLEVDTEIYKYLFKARRHKVGDSIDFRNLVDSYLYTYAVENISKKEAILRLTSKNNKIVENSKKLHLLWSVVDPKTIEKQLPYLNEMGVKMITFFYAEYSQKNFKLNFDKWNKVLSNSSQQCGRSSMIQLEKCDSLESFLEEYPNTYMLNFSEIHVDTQENIETIAIGCEGGFSQKEIECFEKKKIVGFNSNLILKSETAISAVSAKIIL